MRFIDPHLHTTWVFPDQQMKMALMGMEACVSPTPHMFMGNHDADSLLRTWERQLGMDVTTAQTLGYEAYVSLGIPFYGLNGKDIEKCLDELPGYLKHERVVAMGEMGLDHATQNEIDLFRESLRIAKAHDLPIIVHTPVRLAPQGAKVLPEIMRIVNEEKFPVERMVLDHAGEKTLDYRMSTGAVVGLSICFDKMPPEPAAQYVADNPDKLGRILINSELAGEGNDYFTIPKVIFAMRNLGVDKATINKVCWENPKRMFNLPVD